MGEKANDERIFALLEARDPALGRFRSHRLEAGIDLFGFWVVEITFGRIGTFGRRLRYVAGDEAETRKFVQQSLRRRATARKRIGVSYCFRALSDTWQWMEVDAEEQWPANCFSLESVP